MSATKNEEVVENGVSPPKSAAPGTTVEATGSPGPAGPVGVPAGTAPATIAVVTGVVTGPTGTAAGVMVAGATAPAAVIHAPKGGEESEEESEILEESPCGRWQKRREEVRPSAFRTFLYSRHRWLTGCLFRQFYIFCSFTFS